MQTDDVYVHNEASRGRQRQDSADEDKQFGTFVALKMFSQEVPDNLQNIAQLCRSFAPLRSSLPKGCASK